MKAALKVSLFPLMLTLLATMSAAQSQRPWQEMTRPDDQRGSSEL